MKAPMTCICKGNKACPLCKGTGFRLVEERVAKSKLVTDMLNKRAKKPR